MNSTYRPANSSTPPPRPWEIVTPKSALDEEDFALGCESAFPPLQIDAWGREAPPRPLQALN